MAILTVKRGLFIKAHDLNDILFALESSIENNKDHGRISQLVLNILTRQILESMKNNEVSEAQGE